MAKIFTHNEAADIIECFEHILEKNGIKIPDSDRTGEQTEACLCGESYSELLDEVELMLIDLLKRAGTKAKIKKFVFQ